MNEIFYALGIESWKPVLGALMLPTIPLAILVLAGARLMFRRRIVAWLMILFGVLGLWLSTTEAMANGLSQWLLRPARPLSSSEIADLRHAPNTAIVVLGGGRRVLAPEYGMSTLHPRTIERLRYGIWLSRETGLPLAFSGGIGYGAAPGPTEAEVAARVAAREFLRPLRWLEDSSRDTRENAEKSVALLAPEGIRQIVLVTHGFHMRRAMANFERVATPKGIHMIPAPMGLAPSGHLRAGDWLPTTDGFEDCVVVLHEWLGRLAGA